ncbi:MAG: hypothetical protein K9G70_01485 [Prolixibacteraceae bacterium]|nr:hypothetical protein [Prolixibacteraceae bacterium]
MTNFTRLNILIFLLLFITIDMQGQFRNFHTVDVQINFDQHLRYWDGFGITYVQTAHTSDYEEYPQEYGGYSILSEKQKEDITELIFGADGLKPGIAKLFLDPLHQEIRGGDYNHELSTKYLVDFYKRGIKKTTEDNRTLSMITTLYGPPAYMTLQNKMRGRDFDVQYTPDLVNYYTDWVRYLRNDLKFPLDYVSLHNEGDDWRRWPNSGEHTNFDHGHDYNLYWSPNFVANMMIELRKGLDKKGLQNIGVTPGETQNWFKFYFWGYADSIASNKSALESMNLITSHGFNGFTYGRWYSGTNNLGTDLLRKEKPGLKAWVTSDSWGKMDVNFICNIWAQIYQCKINGFIPWAVIQRPTNWVNNDPNPGTAFVVSEDGTYRVTKGYYYYKQVSRAGQPGMKVAKTFTMDSELLPMAFSSTKTNNQDAFVLINTGITATYRADMLQVDNGNSRMQFSLTDPTKNKRYEQNNNLVIQKTNTGFNVEFVIDATDLNKNKFDLTVFDGENSNEGILGWEKDGSIAFDKFQVDENQAYIPLVDQAPIVDAEQDAVYSNSANSAISESRHPHTSEQFKANWRAVRTATKIYFFIEIIDPTNYQERQVRLTVDSGSYKKYQAYRTSDQENYQYIGDFELDKNGQFIYECPPASVTTFFGIK